MNHYRVLQVARDAEPEVIEKAYRALAMKRHPDRAGSSAAANRRMQRLNEAYAVLSDPSKRAAYDRVIGPESSGGHVGDLRRTRLHLFWEDGLVGLFFDTWSRRDRV